MQGVLILAHGSRVKSTIDTIEAVVDKLREKMGDMPIETAYMEFCYPNIEEGVRNLIKRGVTEIKAIPYFLFDGVHIKEDIPAEINKALEGTEGITVTMGRTLGADSRLAEILADRISEI